MTNDTLIVYSPFPNCVCVWVCVCVCVCVWPGGGGGGEVAGVNSDFSIFDDEISTFW